MANGVIQPHVHRRDLEHQPVDRTLRHGLPSVVGKTVEEQAPKLAKGGLVGNEKGILSIGKLEDCLLNEREHLFDLDLGKIFENLPPDFRRHLLAMRVDEVPHLRHTETEAFILDPVGARNGDLGGLQGPKHRRALQDGEFAPRKLSLGNLANLGCPFLRERSVEGANALSVLLYALTMAHYVYRFQKPPTFLCPYYWVILDMKGFGSRPSHFYNYIILPKMSSLPKIMYDQSQFTPLYMMDKDGVYMNTQSYFELDKLTGYAPENWYLYTQKIPESFFFGAYDEAALKKESEVGLITFSNPKHLDDLERFVFEKLEEVTSLKNDYLVKFHQKSAAELIDHKADVIAFINKLKHCQTDIVSRYIETQPQRFYAIENLLKTELADNEDLALVTTHGRRLTLASQLRQALVNYHSDPQNNQEIINKFGFLNWGTFGGFIIDQTNTQSEADKTNTDAAAVQNEKRELALLETAILNRKNILTQHQNHKQYLLADAMGHVAVIRFDLQTLLLCLVNYFEQIARTVAEHHQVSNEDLKTYECSEIIELINSGAKVNKNIMAERENGYLRVLNRKESKTYAGQEAREKISELLNYRQKEIIETKAVAGTIASWPDKSLTKIIGRAFVLTTAFDAESKLVDFKPGDILVATQTHPNLISIMKEAEAIITDEGGVTCHAAIVSRELKKPCVIGTRLATKIFKTGDLIEIKNNGEISKK